MHGEQLDDRVRALEQAEDHLAFKEIQIRESLTDQALVCLNNIKFLDIHQGPEA